MQHELRTLPVYFEQIRQGNKPFEIRKNDREFQRDDTLWLREWEQKYSYDSVSNYTGRSLRAKVSFVVANFEGLAPGYVAMGLTELSDD